MMGSLSVVQPRPCDHWLGRTALLVKRDKLDTFLNNPMATPRAFICPITCDIMDQPAVAADGNSYERAAIQQWLQTRTTSPLTNVVLHSNELVPNIALRDAIEEWLIQQARPHFVYSKSNVIHSGRESFRACSHWQSTRTG